MVRFLSFSSTNEREETPQVKHDYIDILPDDALLIIFGLCTLSALNYTDPYLSLRLSHVCRKWRQLSRQHPSLWVHTHVDEHPFSQFCLGLSQSALLDVVLCQNSEIFFCTCPMRKRKLDWEAIAKFMQTHLPRIGRILCHDSLDVVGGVMHGPAPELHTLKLYYGSAEIDVSLAAVMTDILYNDSEIHGAGFLLENAPKLRVSRWDAFLPPQSSSLWQNQLELEVAHLDKRYHGSYDWVSILAGSPDLRTFSLHADYFANASHTGMFGSALEAIALKHAGPFIQRRALDQPFSLSSLQNLRIKDKYPDMMQILKNIRMPTLKDLNLEVLKDSEVTSFYHMFSEFFELSNFGKNIQKLHIRVTAWSWTIAGFDDTSEFKISVNKPAVVSGSITENVLGLLPAVDGIQLSCTFEDSNCDIGYGPNVRSLTLSTDFDIKSLDPLAQSNLLPNLNTISVAGDLKATDQAACSILRDLLKNAEMPVVRLSPAHDRALYAVFAQTNIACVYDCW